MKKIIWLTFAVLAAMFTGFVMIALQLTGWALATVSSLQMPEVVNNASQWTMPLPSWAAPWIDTAWLQTMKTMLISTVQGLHDILPAASSLDGWISALVWIGWGFGMAALLALALGMHWLAGRAAPQKLQG